MPTSADNRHIGTIRMIASGRLQLSYCADSARNTNSTHSGKMYSAVLPASTSCSESSVHSKLNWLPSASFAAAVIFLMASPEETPGAVPPLRSALGYRL